MPTSYLQWYDSLFRFDMLSVRQKLLTLSQKYYIEDELGRPRFYVVRPPKLFLNFAVGLATSVVSFGCLIAAVIFLGQQRLAEAFATIIVGNVVARAVAILLAPYRDVTIFTDESESTPLLQIVQEDKLAFVRRYTLVDPFGVVVAECRRHWLESVLRRTWTVHAIDGSEICLVQEDRLMFALLRRYFGSLYGLLRTNFEFIFPDGTSAGRYDRKLTITDQYLLDLRADTGRLLDRRVALAMAVLLDTAESR